MTQATPAPAQTTGPAAPNANVTSTRWTAAGVPQTTRSWCFAAAEALIQRGFGVTVTQPQLAHEALVHRGRNEDGAAATQYYQAVRGIYNDNTLADTSWASVEQHVRRHSGGDLYNLLRTQWSVPLLRNRTFAGAGAPDPARIVQTIDAGGLVLVGSDIHWKVIYGYSSGPNGAVTHIKMYNPWEGGTDHQALAVGAALTGLNLTFYVTG